MDSVCAIIPRHASQDEDFWLNLRSNPLESECVTVPRGRGRPKLVSDDRRRAELVELAMGVFIELGYARTTMDVVAARARVSKQTLYRFFPGKTALFAAVIEHHRRFMMAPTGDYDHLPPAEALARIFRTDIDDDADDDRMLLVSVIMAESIQNPELLDVVEAHGAEPARADLGAWMRREIERGRIRSDDDPELLAGILLDMVFAPSEYHRYRRRGVRIDAETRRTHVERCIRIFLSGVAA